MRQLRGLRSFVSKKQLGIFAAIFALLAQPLGLLPIDGAYAATGVPDSVVINEFSANNGPDWVELYNTTGGSIDLTGWKLRDASASNNVLLSGFIPAGGIVSFSFGTDLNAAGDTVKLLDDSDVTIIDSITYPGGVAVPAASQYAARTNDGA